jgi:hypothetical protein
LSICSKSSKYILLTLSTSGPAQVSGNLLPPPLLRWNDLGGYPCRRGDLGRTLWNPCDVLRSRLIPEYGGSCAVRERARASGSQGHGSVSERPLNKGCNDVAVDVDGFGQACCFLASFGLPFALRGSSGEAITDEAWGLGPGEARWHTVRSRDRELELLFGR